MECIEVFNYELPARLASESVAGRQITNDEVEKKFQSGVDIGEGDGIVKAKDVRYLGDNKFKIILTEGRKRQIRRMFKTVGCEIKDLVRVRIENIELGSLTEGQWRKLNNEEHY